MATLPTLPTFVFGDHSLTNLQELSQAVAFLVDCDVKPTCHLFKTATVSGLTAGSWTQLNFGSMAYDNDGMWTSSSFMTVQTNGYYAFEACYGFITSTTNISVALSFYLVAGVNNPLQATINSGGGTRFGNRGGESVSVSGCDSTYCITDLAPYALYTGDQVYVHAQPSTSVNGNANTSSQTWSSGRFNANFTGMWVRHV